MRAGAGVWTFAAVLGMAWPAAAASFDCAKAGNATEKAICADPAISRMDEQAAEAYRAAQGLWPGGTWPAFLRNDQRNWLRDRNANCKGDRACLKRDYEIRLTYLRKPDLRYTGRYVQGRCPADGLYLDVTPNHPQAGVEVLLYICPDTKGNVLVQTDGAPDAGGRLATDDAGCRREFRFTQDAVTLNSTGPRCGTSFKVDGTYRRDPAKSPYLDDAAR